MKQTLGLTLVIITFLVLMYFFFSIGNGSFDFSTWNEMARKGFALGGGMGSMLIIVSKWMLGWEIN